MTVILRTLEILVLLGALGLPVNLLLLTRIDCHPQRWRVSARLLLAPVTGLAVFAVYTTFFFATWRPVAAAVPLFWFLPGVLWLAALVVSFPPGRRTGRHRFGFSAGGRSALPHGLALVGLLIALAGYAWPFIEKPDLVFWHYAGSDGYMYMRIAEHVAAPGTGVIPTVGVYDAASGFLAKDLLHLHQGWFTDKPGTMATLAGLAGLLGLTTHEAFSPLVLAGLAMLYLVLVVFGQSLLRLPAWASAAFAALGTVALPVWTLGTHTFFANVLALPFYPLILLTVRPSTYWRSAVYVGLVLAGQTLLFPDGELALVGVLLVATPYLLWIAWRKRRLRRLLAAGVVAAGTAVLLVLPLGRVLFATTFWRFFSVLSFTPQHLFTSNGTKDSASGLQFHFLSGTDWIWPAFNLNTVPPQPLMAGEIPYALGYAGLLVLFVVASVWRRRMVQLLFYLLSIFLLLAFGLAGFFQSDYELFRALAVFAFVPLAAVCVLPGMVAGRAGPRRALVLRIIVLAVLAPLLVHFARTDLRQFRFAFDEHAADAQYTAGNLRDREEITRLGGSNSLMLGSETTSFTAAANVVTLFSGARLGVPVAFHKFFFFDYRIRSDEAYESDLVVRNLRYSDIVKRMPDLLNLYSSPDFEVVENDLEPFFDNDTLPMVYGFTAEALKKRQLPVVRAMLQKTEIKFYSRASRPVVVELQFAPDDRPASLPAAFDDDAPQEVVLTGDGRVILSAKIIGPRLHKLVLGPLARPAQITSFRLRANGAKLAPGVP